MVSLDNSKEGVRTSVLSKQEMENSAHSIEETHLQLSASVRKNKSQNSCTTSSARGLNTIRAIGGGRQWVEAADGTIHHICEGYLAASASTEITMSCLAILLGITLC